MHVLWILWRISMAGTPHLIWQQYSQQGRIVDLYICQIDSREENCLALCFNFPSSRLINWFYIIFPFYIRGKYWSCILRKKSVWIFLILKYKYYYLWIYLDSSLHIYFYSYNILDTVLTTFFKYQPYPETF